MIGLQGFFLFFLAQCLKVWEKTKHEENFYITMLYNQNCLVKSLVKSLEVWKMSVSLWSKTIAKNNKTQIP